MSLYGGTGKNSGVGGESGGNDRNGGRSRNDSTASETPGDDYHRQLVDERTRLLPNRIDSPRPRVLSPDDPAVTPYNVWSVRVVRSISIVLLVVTLLWWCLILISAFITPPGLYVRGSPFFAFAFTTVALLDIVTLALFFSAPSRGHRIQGGLLSILLLIDLILILAVEQLRHEEAWAGVASVAWACIMSCWCSIVDSVVKKGKAGEEERLTGRPETRRTLWEWTQTMFANIMMVALNLVVVMMTATLILRALDAGLAAPGTRYWVDGDKYQLHLYCRGTGVDGNGTKVPTVLFEAGEETFESTLWSLADAAIANGSIGRYCFSDRPGYAWSDAAPSPFSAGMAADALSEALAKADEHGPWVLASAGIGSVYSRIFSSRHGRDVSAMLFIDPSPASYLEVIGEPGRGFRHWLRGVFSPLGWNRVPGAIFRARTKEDRVYGRSAYQSGKYQLARLQQNLVARSWTRREVDNSSAIQNKSTPLIVISSGKRVKGDATWEKGQLEVGRKVTDKLLHWDIVNDAPHEVWETLAGRMTIEKRLRELVRDRR